MKTDEVCGRPDTPSGAGAKLLRSALQAL